MRVFVIILGLIAFGIGLSSRFHPQIEYVAVAGNSHYSQAEIAWLAGVEAGDPLLWVNRWSVAGLAADPWIEWVSVVRHWPDTVSLTVREREPRFTDGVEVWSADGVKLPQVPDSVRSTLPLVTGWGEDRTAEVLQLFHSLDELTPLVISYTPDGFDITLADARIFTPGVELVEAQWAAIKGRLGNRLAVYPWGVSENYE
jgi:cell division septal protein FtsQ